MCVDCNLCLEKSKNHNWNVTKYGESCRNFKTMIFNFNCPKNVQSKSKKMGQFQKKVSVRSDVTWNQRYSQRSWLISLNKQQKLFYENRAQLLHCKLLIDDLLFLWMASISFIDDLHFLVHILTYFRQWLEFFCSMTCIFLADDLHLFEGWLKFCWSITCTLWSMNWVFLFDDLHFLGRLLRFFAQFFVSGQVRLVC